MTSKRTNAPTYQVKSAIWKEACEILLPSSSLNKLDPLQIDDIIEEVFVEHFQEFFTYYNEELICNNRHVGINKVSPIQPTDNDLWIFGYGSLVWKADFSYIDKKQGFIEGYQRRFFQHSIDHRGTHEKPGRVVTLVPTEDKSGRVYGVAYRIASCEKDQVLAHLDFREKNGYVRCTLKFTEFGSDESFDIIMYIATEENESFAGGDEKNLEPIAEQIYLSAGPSGPNREYLYNLANAMRELFPGVDDEHLYMLERIVKMRERLDQEMMKAVKAEIRGILEGESVDEMVDKVTSLKNQVRTKEAVSRTVWGPKK